MLLASIRWWTNRRVVSDLRRHDAHLIIEMMAVKRLPTNAKYDNVYMLPGTEETVEYHFISQSPMHIRAAPLHWGCCRWSCAKLAAGHQRSTCCLSFYHFVEWIILRNTDCRKQTMFGEIRGSISFPFLCCKGVSTKSPCCLEISGLIVGLRRCLLQFRLSVTWRGVIAATIKA